MAKAMSCVILPPKADFCKKLEYLMIREGYDNKSLARKIGVHSQMIANYVKGLNKPRIQTLRKLAKLFNVYPEWLLRTEEV